MNPKKIFQELTLAVGRVLPGVMFLWLSRQADANPAGLTVQSGSASCAVMIHAMLADNTVVFSVEDATTESKLTVFCLLLLSLCSWTIIITKFRQLMIARSTAKKFFAAYAATRDPLDIKRRSEEFDGAPAYELYDRGAEALLFQLKNNPMPDNSIEGPSTGEGNPDHLARAINTKISPSSFEAVKVVLEEAAGAQAKSLEKGMIVLSTAVAGGTFIGLFGIVWGVLSTCAGTAEEIQASLTAMAPGVAAALVATVTGLLVVIPAMFGYKFMVTTIRNLTEELDGFATRYAHQMEHIYVDSRDLE